MSIVSVLLGQSNTATPGETSFDLPEHLNEILHTSGTDLVTVEFTDPSIDRYVEIDVPRVLLKRLSPFKELNDNVTRVDLNGINVVSTIAKSTGPGFEPENRAVKALVPVSEVHKYNKTSLIPTDPSVELSYQEGQTIPDGYQLVDCTVLIYRPMSFKEFKVVLEYLYFYYVHKTLVTTPDSGDIPPMITQFYLNKFSVNTFEIPAEMCVQILFLSSWWSI